MKIAIIADTHFGYSRFEEDAFVQAEYALRDAERKADAIIVAGDIFDVKIPRLETLKRAADIFSRVRGPVYVVHGNHERRGRDMTNPVQLLSMLSNIKYMHSATEVIEGPSGKVSLTFMGSVPEELAKNALGKLMEQERGKLPADAFKILVMHQSVSELVYGNEEELSFDDLKALPFDLIVDGHIHKHHVEMGGKLIIPGSTVITQLRNDEQGERGYVLYDTNARKGEFIPVPSRLFFYNEMKFENAALAEVKERIEAWIAEMRAKHRDAILKIKLTGTLKEGLCASDLSLSYHDGIYVQNGLNVESIGEKIKRMREQREEKLSMREIAVRQLRDKLKGRITLFDPLELFEKLAESPEAGAKYLNIEQ
ncbi:3',5'-cyclic adenosine monophosphate phosphodiesterase CpdA [uncultured archaeon]|nr:3',5'-cyclic adenosine monophosphate phosphodiesterase CpdA [uncultured archaeon]